MAFINSERDRFWGRFNEILEEEGRPFSIRSREHPRDTYASINLPSPSVGKTSPIVEFLTRKKLMRVSIYIKDDRKTPCFDLMYAAKDAIEAEIGETVIWKDGDKNSNTKRIRVEMPFDENDVLDGYDKIIRWAIPVALRVIDVANKYIPCKYRG